MSNKSFMLSKKKSDFPSRRLYSLKNAAEYLGRSEWSMRELIWAGKIPVVRGGSNEKIYIDIMDLDKFIVNNKNVYE